MSNEHSPGDDELEWLLAELADEVRFEARFADAQQRMTRIVADDPGNAANASGRVPSFDDPAMLDLLLELDPALADRVEPPAD